MSSTVLDRDVPARLATVVAVVGLALTLASFLPKPGLRTSRIALFAALLLAVGLGLRSDVDGPAA